MGQEEPTLEEILDDPIIRAVMARDGVEPEQIRSLLAEVAEH